MSEDSEDPMSTGQPERFSNRPVLRQLSVGEYETEDRRYTIISSATGWTIYRGDEIVYRDGEEVATGFDSLAAAGNWIGDEDVRRAGVS